MLKELSLISPIIIPLILAAILFYSSNKNNRPKLFLSIFMLTIAYSFLGNYFYFEKEYAIYTYMHSLHIGTILLIYPGIYVYIRLLTNPQLSLRTMAVHFLPALFFTLLSTALFYSLLSLEERMYFIEYYRFSPDFTKTSMKVLFIFRMSNIFILFVQVITYSILTFQLLRKYHKEICEVFSNPEKYQLNWLKGFNIALAFSSLACVVLYTVNPIDLFSNDNYLAYPLLIIALTVWYLGIMGNNQRNLVLLDRKDTQERVKHTNTASFLALEQKIITYMEDEKPYLDPDFKISELCRQVGTNRSYISAVINDRLGKNFASYVNSYRIREAQELMLQDNQRTFVSIATSVGFGSLGTFNRVFSKKVGLSPSGFVKQNRT